MDEFQVRDGSFIKEDKTAQITSFMYGTEYNYLEDGRATGFIKYYDRSECAFVALLPNEGTSVSEYLASLDPKTFRTMLSNSQNIETHTSIPKFETEYSVEMSDALKAMGIKDAFDMNSADLSGLGTHSNNNVYVSSVIHKTFISVAEQGTRAGASTEMSLAGGCAPGERETREVYLDRPFVYMLIDCDNDLPFFIGTMMDVEG